MSDIGVDGAGVDGAVGSHWFEALADHLGPAYLRYSFTKGTSQEVDALCAITGLEGGRVLDVGCGPGRHAIEFTRRGFDVVGVDISSTFVDLATTAASAANLGNCRFVRGDARQLQDLSGVAGESFDLVISLCQGAFGLTGGPAADTAGRPGLPRELDEPILGSMQKMTKPGAWVVVSAFSAYFQMRFTNTDVPNAETPEGAPEERFDAASGVNHEWTTIRDAAGLTEPAELWTTCYTPRELRLLARLVGLRPVDVFGVAPGRYGRSQPTIDCPEFLLVARSVTSSVPTAPSKSLPSS